MKRLQKLRINILQKNSKDSGFTILELLIATLVFSMILLLVTNGVLKIGNTYYKGALQTRTQDAARNIMDEISRGIQFSSEEVVPTRPCVAFCTGVPGPAPAYEFRRKGDRYGFCVAGRGYSYIIDRQRTIAGNVASINDNGRRILVSYTPGTGTCTGYGVNANPVWPPHSAFEPSIVAGVLEPTNEKELLGIGMRLLDLQVEKVPGQGNENAYRVVVAVGSGERELFLPDASPTYGTATQLSTGCKSGVGSQYCAVSRLETVVQQRVNRVVQ